MMKERFVAFYSYTRSDDQLHDGRLTEIRNLLQANVRAALGDHDLGIFQDVDDIERGELWRERLNRALADAVFLIPVITPSFFKSPYCREELSRFWEKSKTDPATRIIPVYWRHHYPLHEPAVDDERDELLEVIRAIERRDDWRGINLLDVPHIEVRSRVDVLATYLAGRWRDLERAERRRKQEAERQAVEAEAAAAAAAEKARAETSAAESAKRQPTSPSALPPPLPLPPNMVGRQPSWLIPRPALPQTADIQRALEELLGPSRERAGAMLPRRDGRFPAMIGTKGHSEMAWLLPGDTRRDIDIGPEMVLVPPGETPVEWDNQYDPNPRATRFRSIKYPLLVGRIPITCEEYIAALRHSEWKPRPIQVPPLPLQAHGRAFDILGYVSWHDAESYVSWLTAITGKAYRLLSEGEYLHCRPLKLEFLLGDDTQEWCADPWHLFLKGSPMDGSVWVDAGDQNLRVVCSHRYRSIYRDGLPPDTIQYDIGFRVCRTL